MLKNNLRLERENRELREKLRLREEMSSSKLRNLKSIIEKHSESKTFNWLSSIILLQHKSSKSRIYQIDKVNQNIIHIDYLL